MDFERFDGLGVFRPGRSAEELLRVLSEAHLRRTFEPGKYFDRTKINSILQHQFGFYQGEFELLLPRVASRHFLEFVLDEFEKLSEIEYRSRSGGLSFEEAQRWNRINKTIRRATKFLAERILHFEPEEEPQADPNTFLEIAEKLWICAEEMVNLYVTSDLVHSVYPDTSG